jgi:threonine synthase
MFLGEGDTPLVPLDWDGAPSEWRHLLVKMESLNPTGSFKDRGAAVLVTALRGLGITQVVEDSSGNAGASLAAYAARAGIPCEICVPDTAANPKIAQMTAHGAEVIQIKGKREYAALAAWAAAAHGAYYASHIFNPFFLAGTETLAYELWEQLGGQAPAMVIVPVGNGGLLLGIHHGFKRLKRAHLLERLPCLMGVQARSCAPIHHAFSNNLEAVEPIACGATVARAIAIKQPARGTEVLAAVRETKGAIVAVTDEQIKEARNQMARQGFYVEESAAAGLAALWELADAACAVDRLALPGDAGPLVVPLTGHGLKTRSGPG